MGELILLFRCYPTPMKSSHTFTSSHTHSLSHTHSHTRTHTNTLTHTHSLPHAHRLLFQLSSNFSLARQLHRNYDASIDRLRSVGSLSLSLSPIVLCWYQPTPLKQLTHFHHHSPCFLVHSWLPEDDDRLFELMQGDSPHRVVNNPQLLSNIGRLMKRDSGDVQKRITFLCLRF